MKKHRLSRRQIRHIQDICQSAFILLCSVLFLLFCIFGKQILMVVGGFVCVFALMFVMKRF